MRLRSTRMRIAACACRARRAPLPTRSKRSLAPRWRCRPAGSPAFGLCSILSVRDQTVRARDRGGVAAGFEAANSRGHTHMGNKDFLTDVQTLRKRAREHIEQGAVTAGYSA